MNVEADVFVRVLSFQVEQLSNDNIGHLVVNRHAEHDDALSEQQRVDIKGSFPSGPTLNYHRDNIHRLSIHFCSSFCVLIFTSEPWAIATSC